MRGSLTVAGADLLRLARDRTALFFVLLLPFLIILVVGSSFPADAGLGVGVVDLDDSPESAALIRSLEADEGLEVTVVDDPDGLERDLRLQSFDGGVVIPAGYGDALAGGRSTTVSIQTLPTSPVAMTVITAAGGVVTAAGAEVDATRVVAEMADVDGSTATAAVRSAREALRPVGIRRVEVGDADRGPGSAFGFVAPGQLTLFIFVNSLAAGAALVDLRLLGIARRVVASPAGRRSVVGGVLTARMVFALTQGGLIIAFGALLFGVDWGDPAGAASIVVLFSLVSVGAGVLMGTWASNTQQPTAIGVPAAITMALVGGCMLPSFRMPDAVRVVGHVTPHAWAMDGWVELVFDGGSVADIGVELAVLAGFALAFVGLALARLRRVLA